MKRDVCPTCGGDVDIASSDEGTSFMIAVEPQTWLDVELYARKLLLDREILLRQVGADILQIMDVDV